MKKKIENLYKTQRKDNAESLLEANSRTFHRLQDCLFTLALLQKREDSLAGVSQVEKQDHRSGFLRPIDQSTPSAGAQELDSYLYQALLYAEQSRRRIISMELAKRFYPELKFPLNQEEIIKILDKLEQPLIYLSYTGVHLAYWVFVRDKKTGRLCKGFNAIPLTDDQFDGKSFDYCVRYSLTEQLVERTFEMYQARGGEQWLLDNKPLFQALAPMSQDLGKMLDILSPEPDEKTTLIFITDAYSRLLPVSLLPVGTEGLSLHNFYNPTAMFSLSSLKILDRYRQPVELTNPEAEAITIGDPNIPPFILKGESWSLGRVPYARKESEMAGFFLGVRPMTNEYATKSALMMRLPSARIVHIATHGSASTGFLAFASFVPPGNNVMAQPENVLLFPDELSDLQMKQSLVILASCDSARGVVKAEGVIGMANAINLAGATAIVTLWKIPDESSRAYINLLMQHLFIDGQDSCQAVSNAARELMTIPKYSQYIHWSGFLNLGAPVRFRFLVNYFQEHLQRHLPDSMTFFQFNSRNRPIYELWKQIKTKEHDNILVLEYLPDLDSIQEVATILKSPGNVSLLWLCHQNDNDSLLLASLARANKLARQENILMQERTRAIKNLVVLHLAANSDLPNNPSLMRYLSSSTHMSQSVPVIILKPADAESYREATDNPKRNPAAGNAGLSRAIDKKLSRGVDLSKAMSSTPETIASSLEINLHLASLLMKNNALDHQRLSMPPYLLNRIASACQSFPMGILMGRYLLNATRGKAYPVKAGNAALQKISEAFGGLECGCPINSASFATASEGEVQRVVQSIEEDVKGCLERIRDEHVSQYQDSCPDSCCETSTYVYKVMYELMLEQLQEAVPSISEASVGIIANTLSLIRDMPVTRLFIEQLTTIIATATHEKPIPVEWLLQYGFLYHYPLPYLSADAGIRAQAEQNEQLDLFYLPVPLANWLRSDMKAKLRYDTRDLAFTLALAESAINKLLQDFRHDRDSAEFQYTMHTLKAVLTTLEHNLYDSSIEEAYKSLLRLWLRTQESKQTD